MQNKINAQSARFADRLYSSLLISRACIDMCSTHVVTLNRIKRIDQYAVRV